MREAALQDAAARVAVLPFESLSSEAGDAYFARGFAEDLVVELSRFPTLEVLHPDSSLAPGDPRALLDGAAASHHLRGSVRRTADALRVTAQLVDAATGRSVWAGRFHVSPEEVLALQDEIVARVASTAAIEIDSARLARARRKPLASLEVYDCWLRGLDALHRGTAEDDARARTFFQRALEIDPDYARAHVGLSLSHFNEWSCQAWEVWDEKERLAYEHAMRALALDDADAQVQIVLGRVLLYRREFAQAERHVARALELNPSDADILAQAGICRAFLGDPASGVALAQKAMRLHPRHPEFYLPCLAVPLFVLGRYDEVHDVAAPAPRAVVDLPAYIASGAALAGRADVATRYVAMFLDDFRDKITFGCVPEPGDPLRWVDLVNPYRERADFERLADGLARAGLPLDPDAGALRSPHGAAERSADAGRPASEAARPAFRREGALWQVAYAGEVVHLSDAKGFGDLVHLLSRPGEEVHCLELAGRRSEATGADVALDERARREVRERIRELEEQIDEAVRRSDAAGADRARGELDQLVTTLAGALGLGGRPRRVGSAVERARCTVTWRMRSAIRKLAAVHAPLGRHLDNAIRTGTTCAYVPETPVDWLL